MIPFKKKTDEARLLSNRFEKFNFFNSYLWPHNRLDLQIRIFFVFLFVFFSKIVTVLMPYTFKWAIDAMLPIISSYKSFEAPSLNLVLVFTPVLLTFVYGLFRSLTAVLNQVRDALFAKVAMHSVRCVAMDVFSHMHRLSMRFHLERKTGGITRVLERGRKGVEDLSRLVVLTLLPTLLEFVLVLGVLAYEFDWRYSAATAVTIALYLLFTYYATEWRITIRMRMNESDTDANTKAVDSLLNYETVKYFCSEKRETARYERSMEIYERSSTQAYTSLAVLNAGQALIFTAGMTLMMVMCVHDIQAGKASIGGFVMINAMLIQLAIPLNFMGMLYREIKQSLIDIEAMFSILAQNPEVSDVDNAEPLRVSQGIVRFEDVHFAYMPERPILKGISFEVGAGKTVAVVGSSGAGKSTLSRLLFRFYEPQSGCILIDGQNIRDVQQASLRAEIGMVPQDTVLFNDTIGYNIRYGRWEATDEEVIEAARLAQIDSFIRSLPQGYESQVGERGLKLSGGEKQRVAIARTILKAPPILVLDEATSALDSFTEKEIQDSLERISKGRTTLVIAHRLSTVIHADEIIVLNQGVIAERGTHSALLEAEGIYAALWNRQRQVDEAREVLKAADVHSFD